MERQGLDKVALVLREENAESFVRDRRNNVPSSPAHTVPTRINGIIGVFACLIRALMAFSHNFKDFFWLIIMI